MKKVEGIKSRMVLLGAMLLCLGMLLSVAMVRTVQADEEKAKVWFTYSDGTVQRPDEKNAIWLRETDTGAFQTDAKAGDTVWSCEERFLVIGTGYHDHTWIDPETGAFQDCEHVPTRGGVTAELQDKDGQVLATFIIRIVDKKEDLKDIIKTEAGKKGDVNGDGKVNIADVKKLLRIISSETENEVSLQVADINGDGKINIADVKKLLRNVAESL